MTRVVEVVFDGDVLKPCKPLDLKKDEHYKVQIEIEETPKDQNAWEILEEMTGKAEGPADWSEEIDHYLYNTPKRSK